MIVEIQFKQQGYEVETAEVVECVIFDDFVEMLKNGDIQLKYTTKIEKNECKFTVLVEEVEE